MTDLTVGNTGLMRRLDVESATAKARLRARYAAEARFKAYGIAALAVTALFLSVLVFDIVRNGLPAMFAHSIVLDVPVSAEIVDPDGKRDVAAIRAADYFPLMRAAMKQAVPNVEGRTAERQLVQILSTGAPDLLREMLVANPALVGQTVKVPLLLSDDADLYYKGVGTQVSTRSNTRGTATPSAVSGEVTLLVSSNDFADQVVTIKKAIAIRAQELRAEASRLERAREDSLAPRIKELREEAAVLQDRVDRTRVDEPLDDKMPSILVAINGGLVKVTSLGDSKAVGETIFPLTSTAEAAPGQWKVVTYETPESRRKVTDVVVTYLEALRAQGVVKNEFNWRFFTSGDSREPELAGIRGALVGSILTLLVTIGLCLPIGVLAAIYLEEFAPKNWFTGIIEVNINNLAAVPSIVFGLLGLAMFLNFFGLPRSAPIVGGLVLALLVLPTIIIASRAAIKAIPPSIKEAALGVGASHQQAVFHHVLPLAMPGIMTGTIIGMAHALGETAPLLMIGMVAFIVDVPQSLTQSATVLPVQIYLWSDLPELAFKYKTAGAILVLLMFLFVMNGLAIWLRKRFERRW